MKNGSKSAIFNCTEHIHIHQILYSVQYSYTAWRWGGVDNLMICIIYYTLLSMFKVWHTQYTQVEVRLKYGTHSVHRFKYGWSMVHTVYSYTQYTQG